MKTIIILVVIVLLVRIDYFLGLFDKASEKFATEPQGTVVTEPIGNRELIPVAEDRTLKKTPKETFLALLEDFRTFPTPDIRERAMTIFKESPGMFSAKLDSDLESHVYSWRELLNNNEPEVVNFLLDLMNVLQGENLEMVKKFFALWMDINMSHFIPAYSRTKDSNCTIATTFGENIPEEEKINEYYEREEALKTYLERPNLDPAHKNLATNCRLQLTIAIEKIAPKNLESESDPDAAPATSITISPDPSAAGLTP